MKIVLSILITIVLCQNLFSQAKMQFDSTIFNLGYITENSATLKKDIYFTNVGNEPLIITRVGTGDGGSFATWEKEPVASGKKGKITFVYDRKRIGKFNRSILVESNNHYGQFLLTVKGEVIRKRTTIEASQKTFDLGEIDFDSIVEFHFFVRNSGDENLYFTFDSYRNYDIDLLSLNMEQVNDSVKKLRYDSFTEIGDSLLIKGQIFNLFGNTGAFKRTLNFVYNSHDTLAIELHGEFLAKETKNKLNKSYYEKGFQKYFYENNMLQKIEHYSFDKSLKQIYFFEKSYVSKILSYQNSWKGIQLENEKYFKNGVLSEEIRLDLSH
jgi:hypothetical protein